MQHRLGIAVGLRAALEYQITCSLERDAGLKVRRHGSVSRVKGKRTLKCGQSFAGAPSIEQLHAQLEMNVRRIRRELPRA